MFSLDSITDLIEALPNETFTKEDKLRLRIRNYNSLVTKRLFGIFPSFKEPLDEEALIKRYRDRKLNK